MDLSKFYSLLTAAYPTLPKQKNVKLVFPSASVSNVYYTVNFGAPTKRLDLSTMTIQVCTDELHTIVGRSPKLQQNIHKITVFRNNCVVHPHVWQEDVISSLENYLFLQLARQNEYILRSIERHVVAQASIPNESGDDIESTTSTLDDIYSKRPHPWMFEAMYKGIPITYTVTKCSSVLSNLIEDLSL